MDPEMYKALDKWASDEFRSLNGQIEYLLSRALKAEKRLKAKSEKNKPENKESKEP